MLGAGKKLFAEGIAAGAFQLVASRVSPNGIVCARYLRAGAVQTGSFAMDPPTPAELARREKLNTE